jgi:pyruvate kinase
MSGQAQQRLSQYMIEVALMAIADHNAKRKGTDVVEELGSLYYNRMLKSGLKRYQSAVANLLKEGSTDQQTELALATGDE